MLLFIGIFYLFLYEYELWFKLVSYGILFLFGYEVWRMLCWSFNLLIWLVCLFILFVWCEFSRGLFGMNLWMWLGCCWNLLVRWKLVSWLYKLVRLCCCWVSLVCGCMLSCWLRFLKWLCWRLFNVVGVVMVVRMLIVFVNGVCMGMLVDDKGIWLFVYDL